LLSSFCPSIPKRDLETKKSPPNVDVCPESLEAMLEYWFIKRGLLVKIRPNEPQEIFREKALKTIVEPEELELNFASYLTLYSSSDSSVMTNFISICES